MRSREFIAHLRIRIFCVCLDAFPVSLGLNIMGTKKNEGERRAWKTARLLHVEEKGERHGYRTESVPLKGGEKVLTAFYEISIKKVLIQH